MPDSDFLSAVSVLVAVPEVLHVEDPLDRPACPSVFGTSFLVSITTTSGPPSLHLALEPSSLQDSQLSSTSVIGSISTITREMLVVL